MLLVRLPVTSRLLVVEFRGESNVILRPPNHCVVQGATVNRNRLLGLALTVISPQGLLSTISSPAGVATVLWVNERQLGKERLSFRLLGG